MTPDPFRFHNPADDYQDASFTGWGQVSVPALLKPLLTSPKVDLRAWSAENNLKLDDLGLTDEQKATIRERCKEIIDHNSKQAQTSI